MNAPHSGFPEFLSTLQRVAARTPLVETADHERCDVIVMPTRGGSPVKRWLVGGVTEQVMRSARTSVLVIRSQTSVALQGRVGRILVPLYHPGPRAQLHRTFVQQQQDFARLRAIVVSSQ